MIATNPPSRKLTSRRELLRTAAVAALLASYARRDAACGPSLSRKLFVKSSRLRDDEPFVVPLENPTASECVVLTAAFGAERGNQWFSTSIFEAAGGGVVDTSE